MLLAVIPVTLMVSALTVPLTSNADVGADFPIPTFPPVVNKLPNVFALNVEINPFVTN